MDPTDPLGLFTDIDEEARRAALETPFQKELKLISAHAWKGLEKDVDIVPRTWRPLSGMVRMLRATLAGSKEDIKRLAKELGESNTYQFKTDYLETVASAAAILKAWGPNPPPELFKKVRDLGVLGQQAVLMYLGQVCREMEAADRSLQRRNGERPRGNDGKEHSALGELGRRVLLPKRGETRRAPVPLRGQVGELPEEDRHGLWR